jgi:hypothetical protein
MLASLTVDAGAERWWRNRRRLQAALQARLQKASRPTPQAARDYSDRREPNPNFGFGARRASVRGLPQDLPRQSGPAGAFCGDWLGDVHGLLTEIANPSQLYFRPLGPYLSTDLT